MARHARHEAHKCPAPFGGHPALSPSSKEPPRRRDQIATDRFDRPARAFPLPIGRVAVAVVGRLGISYRMRVMMPLAKVPDVLSDAMDSVSMMGAAVSVCRSNNRSERSNRNDDPTK